MVARLCFATGNGKPNEFINMKTISLVIPVYNEEARLDKTFSSLASFSLPGGLMLEKVIFVDDGSTDGTVKKIKEFIKSSTWEESWLHSVQPATVPGGAKTSTIPGVSVNLQLVSYKENRGKGYAIAAGMKESTSDYSLFLDADMSTDLSEVRKFMPSIRERIPIIIGTRKNSHSTVVRHQPFIRESLGKAFTLLSNLILNTWVSDFTCGFKAFSREAKDALFPNLKIEDWGFDAELMFLGRIAGFEYKEIPVIWSDDRRSKVNIIKDAPKSFWDLIYIRIMDVFGSYETGIKRTELRWFQMLAKAVKTIRSYLF